MFERIPVISGLSNECTWLKVPSCIPVVIEIRWLVPSPLAVIPKMDDMDIQNVPLAVVLEMSILGVNSELPNESPTTEMKDEIFP